MGLYLGFSRGSSDDSPSYSSTTIDPPRDGNPNKYRFTLVRRLDFPKFNGRVSVVEVNYPDCFNHKGNKIMVYADSQILDKGLNGDCLDPHFLKIGESPVARFEPTETGWILAISLAKIMCGESTIDDK